MVKSWWRLHDLRYDLVRSYKIQMNICSLASLVWRKQLLKWQTAHLNKVISCLGLCTRWFLRALDCKFWLFKSLLHTAVCPAPVGYYHRGKMSAEWVACLFLSFLFTIFVLRLAFIIRSIKFDDKMLLLYNRLCVNEANSSQLWIPLDLSELTMW